MKLAIGVLFGAMVSGAGAGALLYWVETPDTPPTVVHKKPRTLVPYVAEGAADSEWKSRANESAAPAIAYVPRGSGGGLSARERWDPAAGATPYRVGDPGAAARARQNVNPRARTVRVPLL